MHVLEGFKSVAQGFFHLSTTAAPPRRLWSSYLCSIVRVVGAVSAFFFFPHVARFMPGSGGEKGKGGGSEWSKHCSCTQYCDQCRQDCDMRRGGG